MIEFPTQTSIDREDAIAHCSGLLLAFACEKDGTPPLLEVTMRFMVKAAWDVAKGNELIKSGKLGETIQAILDEIKPEAVYFTAEGGKRGCTMIVNMADASLLPAIAEPFFLAGNASVEFLPVMLPEDLAKAGDAIGKAVQKYG